MKVLEWQWLMKIDQNKALTPLRVTACERLVIMLERIHPDSLVLRQNVVTGTAAMLQLELIKSIREEFEHNVSMQLYVTDETWTRVKAARESITEIVREAFTRVRPESTAMDLSREIFKQSAASGTDAIRVALHAVRQELYQS
ncbi:MAG: hypothetical protein RL220_1940, partial [Bacteroidota bacterium]